VFWCIPLWLIASLFASASLGAHANTFLLVLILLLLALSLVLALVLAIFVLLAWTVVILLSLIQTVANEVFSLNWSWEPSWNDEELPNITVKFGRNWYCSTKTVTIMIAILFIGMMASFAVFMNIFYGSIPFDSCAYFAKDKCEYEQFGKGCKPYCQWDESIKTCVAKPAVETCDALKSYYRGLVSMGPVLFLLAVIGWLVLSGIVLRNRRGTAPARPPDNRHLVNG